MRTSRSCTHLVAFLAQLVGPEDVLDLVDFAETGNNSSSKRKASTPAYTRRRQCSRPARTCAQERTRESGLRGCAPPPPRECPSGSELDRTVRRGQSLPGQGAGRTTSGRPGARLWESLQAYASNRAEPRRDNPARGRWPRNRHSPWRRRASRGCTLKAVQNPYLVNGLQGRRKA